MLVYSGSDLPQIHQGNRTCQSFSAKQAQKHTHMVTEKVSNSLHGLRCTNAFIYLQGYLDTRYCLATWLQHTQLFQSSALT